MAAKKNIQAILRRTCLYERLRASFVYDLYWALADSRLVERRQREVQFYAELLDGFRQHDLIFDVGANHGTKTDIFLRLGARVVAIEPDDANQEILRQKFQALRLRRKPVAIVGKAVSEKETVETMWVDAPGSAKNTLSQKWVATLRNDEQRFGATLAFADKKEVRTITLDQLMNAHGVPFFVKIDVEGYEPAVLRGLSRRVPYLSFEVNLPEFRPEGAECIELLNSLDSRGRFNFTGDCQKGLFLERWLDAEAFSNVFSDCAEPSIEIFWKSSSPNA